MKTYTKYLGIIVLVAIELLSVNKLSHYGLETIFALWGGLYFILLYGKFFYFDRTPGAHYTSAMNSSGLLTKPAHIKLHTGGSVKAKHFRADLLKNMWLKLIYLTLTLGHIAIYYYVVKLPS